MPYVNVNDPGAFASALAAGGPVNRKRDGSKAAELWVVAGAPSGLGGGLGLMNIPAERESVRGAVRVVYSFLTPIAWELGDGRWVVSLQHYSTRTTRHQRTIAQAIKYLGKGAPRTLDGRDGAVVLSGKPDTWALPAAA
jgi:hypothetical protein